MRHLVLLRGSMGSGKSTFIKNHGLNQYTLSADDIRLMFQTPVMTEKGTYTINSKNDNKVWKILFELLEDRMKRGEFTIIDATHTKAEAINAYRKLAKEYRYRVTVVDFSDITLEKLLDQNKMRPEHKHVPESVIMNAYERMQTEHVPGWVDVIKPEEFEETMKYKTINLSEWSKIHHIGDVHGCYTALMEYLNGELKEDELYIFVGDYLDRGIENDKTLKFFLEIYNKPNVILLEGNHEHHIKNYAHDLTCDSREFQNNTQPQLENSNIDKKEIRQLIRKLRQVVYYTYDNKTVIVTHGGIAKVPENLMYMSTEQLIKGVGDYNLDIDYAFENNELIGLRGGIGNKLFAKLNLNNIYQIHGHRNIFRLPVNASLNSFNLEGQVETGGNLRVVTLDENGFKSHEIKNNVFNITKSNQATSVEEDIDSRTFIQHLKNHEFIKEKQLGDNISSFNFTRKAFTDKVWDDINVKARGLFINTNTNEIVAKSYNKFFNVGERKETKINSLADNLAFPVQVYNKVNGYLGIVGYDSESDELVIASKSETKGNYAEWFKELFYTYFNDKKVDVIKEYLKENNISLVFEVILPTNDPHIIEYDKDKLVLLDIIKRQVKYQKLPYEEVVKFADTYGLEHKELLYTFNKWTDFYTWYRDVTEDWTIEEEGYVIEDAVGFMTKLKLPYYNFWKQMRGLKDKVARKHEHTVKGGSLYTPLHNKVFSWMKQQDKDYLKSINIIQLRNDFYKN